MSAIKRSEEVLLRSGKKSRGGPSRVSEKEHEREAAVLGEILNGVQRFTMTALYIGCGAAVFAWEAIGKVFQRLYHSGTHPPPSIKKIDKKTKPAGRPRKIKVPILPIDDYDRLDTDQIKERLDDLSQQELSFLRQYEEEHRNREEILREIIRRLAGSG